MKTQQPSPENVLAILVDQHRHASTVDPEMDPTALLTFDTTVAEWRDACDLVDWQPLADALNSGWNMKAEMNEWKAVLEPADQRTLRDVCGFISKHANINDVPDHAPFGGRCGTARAFLAVREILTSLGVPREELHPSTLLAPYLERFGGAFLSKCINLSPGKLPTIVHRGRFHHACQYIGFIAFIITVALGWLSNLILLPGLLLSILAFSISGVSHPLFSGYLEIPGVITLKDLAERLAAVPNSDTTGKTGITKLLFQGNIDISGVKWDVLIPLPANADVCMEAIGITDFSDSDDKWDADFNTIVEHLIGNNTYSIFSVDPRTGDQESCDNSTVADIQSFLANIDHLDLVITIADKKILRFTRGHAIFWLSRFDRRDIESLPFTLEPLRNDQIGELF
jgi:hypothetical protein